MSDDKKVNNELEENTVEDSNSQTAESEKENVSEGDAAVEPAETNNENIEYSEDEIDEQGDSEEASDKESSEIESSEQKKSDDETHYNAQDKKPAFYKSLKFIVVMVLIILAVVFGFFVNQLFAKQDQKINALTSNFDAKIQALDSKYNYQNKIDQLNTQYTQVSSQIKNLNQIDNSQLQAQITKQATELEVLRQQVISAATSLNRSEQFKTIEWQLAEAKYLLRIAQQRIIMEQDVAGALSVLTAVDTILLNTDDVSLYNVREILARDKSILESVQTFDVTGTFIKFNNIKNQVEQFEFFASKPSKKIEKQSFKEAFFNSFNVTELDSDFVGKLDPVLHDIAKQSLILMVEQSQSALLNNQQSIYSLSIEKSKKQLKQYFSSEEQFEWINNELNNLQLLSLSQDIPDVLNSIRALDQYLLSISE